MTSSALFFHGAMEVTVPFTGCATTPFAVRSTTTPSPPAHAPAEQPRFAFVFVESGFQPGPYTHAAPPSPTAKSPTALTRASPGNRWSTNPPAAKRKKAGPGAKATPSTDTPSTTTFDNGGPGCGERPAVTSRHSPRRPTTSSRPSGSSVAGAPRGASKRSVNSSSRVTPLARKYTRVPRPPRPIATTPWAETRTSDAMGLDMSAPRALEPWAFQPPREGLRSKPRRADVRSWPA